MTAPAASSLMSVNVDLQAVFRCLGGDFVLFASAMLAFVVLHQLKMKGAAAKKCCGGKLDPAHREEIMKQASSIMNVKEAANSCPAKRSCRGKLYPAHHGVIMKQASSITNVKLNGPEDKQRSDIKHPPEGHQSEQRLDVNAHLALMRKYAAEGNIKQTLCTFRAIQTSGECLNSTMYNIVMQAWIKCGNVWAAENVMEDMKSSEMADARSFAILMKALVVVRDFAKARSLLQDMRDSGVPASAAPFDELLRGLARDGLFNDGVALLKEMDASGAKPTLNTRESIAALVNGARQFNQGLTDVRQFLSRSGLLHDNRGNVLPPRLAIVIARSEDTALRSCIHDVEIKGAWPRLSALRKNLKQHGFLDRAPSDAPPLDGHWETDHGITVTIEGKTVRWSRPHASRLRFASADRSSCALVGYGRSWTGQVVQPMMPCATKSLKWDNGDVWHSYDGRVIGGTTLFSQSMSKILRDSSQDEAYRARATAVLKCVSKQGLCMPSNVEDALTQYLGNDMYSISVRFDSNTHRADIFAALSRVHPRLGFRHCWVRPSANSCGQRTIVNGEETDEACFNRHIRAVARA